MATVVRESFRRAVETLTALGPPDWEGSGVRADGTNTTAREVVEELIVAHAKDHLEQAKRVADAV